mmetsp:Transcript_11499/g.28882  ORF Transcript_11499/g.28882 Transcript_11499/m.28882 type:complete len:369 (+) Transcript_11499:1-1107(+)
MRIALDGRRPGLHQIRRIPRPHRAVTSVSLVSLSRCLLRILSHAISTNLVHGDQRHTGGATLVILGGLFPEDLVQHSLDLPIRLPGHPQNHRLLQDLFVLGGHLVVHLRQSRVQEDLPAVFCLLAVEPRDRILVLRGEDPSGQPRFFLGLRPADERLPPLRGAVGLVGVLCPTVARLRLVPLLITQLGLLLLEELVSQVLRLVRGRLLDDSEHHGAPSEVELLVLSEVPGRVQRLPVARVLQVHVVLSLVLVTGVQLLIEQLLHLHGWDEHHDQVLEANADVRVPAVLILVLALPEIGLLLASIRELGLELADGVADHDIHLVVLALHLRGLARHHSLGERDPEPLMSKALDGGQVPVLLQVALLLGL